MHLGPDVPIGCGQEAYGRVLVLSVLVYVQYLAVAPHSASDLIGSSG